MKIHYHTILEKDPNPENVHLNEVGKKITIEYDLNDALCGNMEKILEVLKVFKDHGAEFSETASEPLNAQLRSVMSNDEMGIPQITSYSY